MNKFKKYTISLLVIILSLIIFFNKDISSNIIKNTLVLWLDVIIPSVPVSYFLGSLIYNYNSLFLLIYPLFRKLLHFENSTSFTLFIVSFIVGNPTSTVLITDAYNNNQITKLEASRLLRFSSFISFFFILMVFDITLSIPILISQVISSLLIAIFSKNNYSTNVQKKVDFSITSIIEKLPKTLLIILSSMIISSIIKIPLLILFKDSTYLIPTFLSFFEITTGINTLNTLYSGIILLLFSSFLVSFEGIAILLQITINIKKMMLSISDYLLYRIIHGIIATLISIILFLFFNLF